MFATLKELFRANEPELVSLSYTSDHEARFQLQDCDGYRLGRLICRDVYVMCLSTRWESFREINIFSKGDAPEGLSPLLNAAPADFILVAMYPAEGSEEWTSSLPSIAGSPLAYILCKSIEFEQETNPGR